MEAHRFEIFGVKSDEKLLFTGSVPCGNAEYDDCYFEVSLVATGHSASVHVRDKKMWKWSLFFKDLAENWRGWPGEKKMESLEGRLAVSATSDPLGHISLQVKLRDINPGKPVWCSERTLWVEAGQLEGLANDVQNSLASLRSFPARKV